MQQVCPIRARIPVPDHLPGVAEPRRMDPYSYPAGKSALESDQERLQGLGSWDGILHWHYLLGLHRPCEEPCTYLSDR